MEPNSTKTGLFQAAKPRYIKFLVFKKFYQGFTLLEIMVSLAILATAFAAVLSLHSDSMELVISSRLQSRASQLAQYKITEIEVAGLQNVSLKSGEFTEIAPDYTWEILTEPTAYFPWTKVTVIVRNRHLVQGGNFRLVEYMPSEPITSIPLR